MTLSDKQFIEQFEQLTLAPEHFDHLGHIRLAWLYLQQFELEQAVLKVCHGIKAYAKSLGATQKFHWTITDGLVRIMACRMDTGESWPQFLQNNPDLRENAFEVLLQYYSKETLDSDEARQSVMQPDLTPIDNCLCVHLQ